MYSRILAIAFMLGMICGIIIQLPTIAADQSTQPVIYLTFDDGPSEYTDDILDILARYDIPATFFVTAEQPEYFDLIREAAKQGHTIGLHSASHDYATIYASLDAYLEDLENISAIVEEYTGKTSYYLRFPGGSSNTISEKYHPNIMPSLIAAVEDRGYCYYDWNGEIGDAKKYHNVASIIAYGKAQTAEKKDLMLLCHDGKSNEDTVKALPTLIEYYLAEGYTFQAVSEKTPTFHHHVLA